MVIISLDAIALEEARVHGRRHSDHALGLDRPPAAGKHVVGMYLRAVRRFAVKTAHLEHLKTPWRGLHVLLSPVAELEADQFREFGGSELNVPRTSEIRLGLCATNLQVTS
jgi:hypothetical protein